MLLLLSLNSCSLSRTFVSPKDPNFYTWVDLLPTVNTNAMNCDETLAFFINVYNALAMKMIISMRPNHLSCRMITAHG